MNHEQMLMELRDVAHLLGPKDKKILKEKSVYAYEDIFDFKYKNLFVPKTSIEEEQAMGATLVRLFMDPQNLYLTCKYLFNIELGLFQIVVLQTLIKYKFPMFLATRGGSKSFLLALYIMIIMLFDPGTRIVVAGSGLRQSSVIFRYIQKIYLNAEIFRNVTKCDGPKFSVSHCTLQIGESEALGIPIGDGRGVRGLRASRLIVDEFRSLPEEIYHEVIEPFGSVSAAPIEKVKSKAQDELMSLIGLDIKNEDTGYGNQSIIAGTASYDFEHFAKIWKQYKAIIQSGGKRHKLAEIFDGKIPENFDHRNYAIIRLPVELLPKGFMDQENVDRARATTASATFALEYGQCFVKDSTGFFRRTIIEMATANIKNNISFPSCDIVTFDPVLHGNMDREYVIAVDPASEIDNFAIVILEIWPEHRRIVYCWTINRKLYKGKDFYSFCAQKILKLADIFPTDHICIDCQGGGYQVEENLRLEHNLKGRSPLWRVLIPGEVQPTDKYQGRHVLHMVQFGNHEWNYRANHDLKNDLEGKFLLFPTFNAAKVADAIETDKIRAESGEYDDYDDYEAVTFQIEELKDELTTIEHTKTAMGKDHWDTPAIKGVNSKKGRLRKDRYSALLMANSVGRTINPPVYEKFEFEHTGFAAGEDVEVDNEAPMYYSSMPIENIDEEAGFALCRKRR